VEDSFEALACFGSAIFWTIGRNEKALQIGNWQLAIGNRGRVTLIKQFD
jgi:hypothetical protein